MSYILSEEALLEIAEYVSYVRFDRGQTAANKLYKKIFEAIDLVCESPGSWQDFIEGTKKYSIPRSRYYLVYLVTGGNSIYVVSVVHGSREFCYWIDRIKDAPPGIR